MAVSVGSTAFGPLLFALVHHATGSYDHARPGTAAVPATFARAALFTLAPALPAGAHPTQAVDYR